jgi:hypothetical protein
MEGVAEWDGTCQYQELAGYGQALLAFLSKRGLTPVETEKPVYHATLKYAGTLDLIAQNASGDLLLIDYKRTVEEVSVAIQLAAYGMTQNPTMKRYALELREDGTFTAFDFTAQRHVSEWTSCLNTWRILQKLGRVCAK